MTVNARFWYMITTSGAYTAPGRASQCVACGACVSKCPQGIPIIEALQKAKNLLETEDFDDWAQRIQKANRRIT